MTATAFKKTAIGNKYWTRRIIAPSLRIIAAEAQSLEETMSRKIRISNLLKTAQASHKWIRLSTLIPAVCLAFPIAALAQGGSPFDTGFTSIQTLFTGTIAKVASLVAIVIGGYGGRRSTSAATHHRWRSRLPVGLGQNISLTDSACDSGPEFSSTRKIIFWPTATKTATRPK